ncbi:thiamine-phosphate kinase [candidate division KSB1 bacterium]|nr:thiamine-phosphate kinase [candidate division KSB1 bacterium]
MQINELGGEFALIKKLTNIIPSQSKDVLVGIGDDAAVIKSPNNKNQFLLITTDILVEGEHFNKSWSTPEQIGIKSIECNVSDIAAMGGLPTFLVVSLVIPPSTNVEWCERLYQGFAYACNRYGIIIVGGDTTQGSVETINITLLGKVSDKNLCLRSNAKPGDILAVTGELGASSAGLNLLKSNLPITPYLEKKHLTPECRLDAAKDLAPAVNAMIDISDGLASEVNHICDNSNVGAVINEKDIPVHQDVLNAGKTLNKQTREFVLNGGEDFELLFSISKLDLEKLKQTGVKYYPIGEIINPGEGRFLITKNNNKIPLLGGFKHFG